MNENFGNLTLNAGLVDSDIQNIRSAKGGLEGFLSTFHSMWSSSTGDAFEEGVEVGVSALANITFELSRMRQVIDLIEIHNTQREMREAKEGEIASLKPRLYYTETYTTTFTGGDGLEHTETHTRQVLDTAVDARIKQLEKEIIEINGYLDALVEQIRSITGA